MFNGHRRSSRIHTFVLRHFGFIFGALLIFTGLFGHFGQKGIEINGVQRPLSILEMFVLLTIGLALVYVGVRIRKVVYRVGLNEDGIEILGRSRGEFIMWSQVESISRMPFTMPPVYKVISGGLVGKFWFTTNVEVVQGEMGGMTIGMRDYSEMGRIISRKKKEFRI